MSELVIRVRDASSACAFILEAQSIHAQWRDYLAANPNDAQAALVGDVAWHQRWVENYDVVLALLRDDPPSLSSRAANV